MKLSRLSNCNWFVNSQLNGNLHVIFGQVVNDKIDDKTRYKIETYSAYSRIGIREKLGIIFGIDIYFDMISELL